MQRSGVPALIFGTTDVDIITQFLHCEFVLKANYIIGNRKLEKKISHTSELVNKIDYNAKITETENKIPNISNLIKKTGYNTKITEIKKKTY